MARSYARILTAIWRNKEFIALPGDAQRAYLLLVTQPDITAAGTLPLTLRRWTALCGDWDQQQFTNALKELVAGRFISIDGETEEVLIRSFVRWDGGYTNSKRRPVILEAARDVVSDALRRVLVDEFRRLDLPSESLADTASDSASESPSQAAEHDAQVQPLAETSGESLAQVDSLSDAVSDAVSDVAADGTPSFQRVVVGYVSTGGTATHNPQPVPPPAAHDARTVNQRANDLANRYWQIENLCNFPAIANVAKKAIRTGKHSDDEIGVALERLAHDGRSVTTDSLRYELNGKPRYEGQRQSTDDRIVQKMATAARDDDPQAWELFSGRKTDQPAIEAAGDDAPGEGVVIPIRGDR